MNRRIAFLGVAFLGTVIAASAAAQTAKANLGPVPNTPEKTLASYPWEIGPFLQGGLGTANRTAYHFMPAGIKIRKTENHPALGGIFRGRFEYDIEIMPYWQAFTPKAGLQGYTVRPVTNPPQYKYLPTGGGTFTGVSITPIILRWDLMPHGNWEPFVQGGGGLIYTTHKFPPDVLVPHGQPGGPTVWNFPRQFGVGSRSFL